MSDSPHYPTVIPMLHYENVEAAIAWLVRVFGAHYQLHAPLMDGRVTHAQLTFGDGMVMVGWPGADYRSPARHGHIGQAVAVRVADVDAHHARAKAAGAIIISTPEDMFWGDRTYEAADLEGQRWHFSQTLRVLSPAEWGATLVG